MGWDVKATADAVGDALPSVPSLPAAIDTSQAVQWIGIFAGLVFLYWLFRPAIERARRGLHETVFSNWRLALLGVTGIVLSLASGWTTWDGMRNFTKEPLLSGLITFGIQGVMLIIAWLIGESFATGMSQRASARKRGLRRKTQAVAGGIVGLLAALSLAVLHFMGRIDIRGMGVASFDWSRFGDQYVLAGAGVLFVLFLMIAASDVGRPYVQGTRVIIKNSMLWVMFLACMATSVFFSFDSLFTAIFPQNERARAAELRAQNQVAGMVADIGNTIETRRLPAVEELFQKDGWFAYDAQLDALFKASDGADKAIEAHFVELEEARRGAIAEQQQRATTAESSQVGLAGKKTTLTEELARLKGERPGLAAEHAEKKNALDERAKEIDAKRVDAMAEDKGVEGTGKVGKGPVYRERTAELGKLQDYYKVGEERVKDARKRLDATNTRIGQIERELAGIDGELAKLQGEAATAGNRIKMAEAQVGEATAPLANPARVRAAFEQARLEFRQEPSEQRLASLAEFCSQLHGAMAATAATRDRVRGIDCDPQQANEAGGIVFALDKGRQAFRSHCAGGDKLAANTSTDALFGFARRCLADSGLPSKETDALRGKINLMELNRDDKAHRFVVTWNAFEDGNRLAYLALGIAVAIDGLIFMSGLFGANALRSPLSDVPNVRARSAQQLEATINAALGPRQYETASLVLASLRPTANVDGFSALAALDGLDRGAADRVRQVLTAGADIGAVEPVTSAGFERYRVRGELREYLSSIADRHLKSDPSHARRAKLADLVRAALKPHVKEHAEIAANAFTPIYPDRGFTSMVNLAAMTDPYDKRVVARVMNAGTASDVVSPETSGLYYIRPELFETLLEISANDPPSPNYVAERWYAHDSPRRPVLADPRQRDARDGGTLKEHRGEIAAPDASATKQLTYKGSGQRQGGWLKRLLGGKVHTSNPDDDGGNAHEPPSEVIDAFAVRLGLAAENLRQLVDVDHAVDHARAVPQLAKLLGSIREDAFFGAELKRRSSDMEIAIRNARVDLNRGGRFEPWPDQLAEFFERLLPLLMLTEDNKHEAMLKQMLQAARQRETHLFPGGQRSHWVSLVQDHLEAIRRLPRRDPEHWAAVEKCLRQLSVGLAELREVEVNQPVQPGLLQ